ncbi:unnamed protein product [Diplocarpon coronariae]
MAPWNANRCAAAGSPSNQVDLALSTDEEEVVSEQKPIIIQDLKIPLLLSRTKPLMTFGNNHVQSQSLSQYSAAASSLNTAPTSKVAKTTSSSLSAVSRNALISVSSKLKAIAKTPITTRMKDFLPTRYEFKISPSFDPPLGLRFKNTPNALPQSVPDDASRFVPRVESSEDEESEIEVHLPTRSSASRPETPSKSPLHAPPSTVTASRIRSVCKYTSYLSYFMLDLWLEEPDIGLEIPTLQQYLLMHTHILEDEEFLHRGLDRKALKPDVIDVALHNFILPTGMANEMIDLASKRHLPPFKHIETYTHHTCLVCAGIDCPTHGDHSPDSPYSRPLSLGYEDSLRRSRSQLPKEKNDIGIRPKPSTNNCHLVIKYSGLDYKISNQNITLIQEMFLVYKNPEIRACLIAVTLSIPCWTVFAEKEPSTFPERNKKPEWYDNRRKVLKADWMNITSAHLHQDFCGCPDDRPRRFNGCLCASSGLNCASDTCICHMMNRECGPECVSCGALERIDLANKYDYELFKTGCQNVCLQRGVKRKTVIGQSQLVGFRLYLAESVKKGDYLDEYNGENISREEAERRGIVYDRKLLPFLSDLNRDRVIDVARLGNKTRFINRASTAEDGINCEGKIVLINGEHRIKFVALRDVNPGEGLLFNHGNKIFETQDLAMTLPKAAGSKRGKNRDTTAGLYAIRGGKKQCRVRKMRKVAASTRPVFAAEETAADGQDLYAAESGDDYDEVEDEHGDRDEDGTKRGRPRRKGQKHSKYAQGTSFSQSALLRRDSRLTERSQSCGCSISQT